MQPIDPAIRRADAFRLKKALLLAGAFLAFLWWIRGLEWALDQSLRGFGVYPGTLSGAIGILTGPLIHGSFEHLVANSLSVFILLALALYNYPKALRFALPVIWLGSGLGVWLFGRESIHLGASGVTHGLMFFLFLIGLIRRDKPAIAIAMLSFFLFGGMVMTIFPREPGISWEYHLFGALCGALAAVIWRRADPAPAKPVYSWDLEPDEDEADVDHEYELPRPKDVQVLWKRDEDGERGRVIPFPRRNGHDDDDRTVH
ncbi:MAG TPA: rhomboid family intramembrane serine protease [Xanthomonadaceae bacterium]|nr:rhomboid family intramembrane serine protease [Xanthomonadaceae bacterium]